MMKSFFDMFTQELNRVSEESGSDSDIAIVDEYIMEPEEPSKKNQQKSGNVQSAKQPPRLTGPALTDETMSPENYHPGTFNQAIQHSNVIPHGHPMTAQHSHSAMQRAHGSGGMYQQFDPNMHLRGQIMYSQYAHSSSSMQDPHMFNAPVSHPDVNFASGIYNHSHPLHPVPESSFPSNSATLKVRILPDMSSVQSMGHKQYSNLDQVPFSTSEDRTFENKESKDNYTKMNSTADAGVRNVDTGSSRPFGSDTPKPHEFSDKKGRMSKTPILDILGLDEKALKLLKKALGLDSITQELMRRNPDWGKKCPKKNILKGEMRQHAKKKGPRHTDMSEIKESESSSLKSSSEQSSEELSVSSSYFSRGSNYGSSSENDSRKVDIEDQNLYVTFKRKNRPRHRNKNKFSNSINACQSDHKSTTPSRQRHKKKMGRKNKSSEVELGSKKMSKKLSTVVKSQSGTFTVDPLTASSQSSDSEYTTMNEGGHVRELERKIKCDLALGKNKLSNMFTQHSAKKGKKPRKNDDEPFEEVKGPLRQGNFKEIRKLPSEILETLAKEEKRKKRQRTVDSGSDDVLERPNIKRKRINKLKFKNKAADQIYIPCVTGGATEFGLSRLDKDSTLTLAEKAAKFRTEQLYGDSVKRITIVDFKHQWSGD